MSDDGKLVEVSFPDGAEPWPLDTGDTKGRDDQYITVSYDMTDGSYSLTYHPLVREITTPHFTQIHAALALRSAGYSAPQITHLLSKAYHESKEAC